MADISRIILVYKLPLQSVILGLGLGLKAKIFGLDAQVLGLGLAVSGLGLVPCGLVNFPADQQGVLKTVNDSTTITSYNQTTMLLARTHPL